MLCADDGAEHADAGAGCVTLEQPNPQPLLCVPSCPPSPRVRLGAGAATAGCLSAVLPTAAGQTSCDRLLEEPGSKESGQTGSR